MVYYNLCRAVCLFSLLSCVLCSNKLLFILVDGLRWDYLHEPGLKGFERMKENGVRAEYLRSVWPTSSAPNYYSMLTGRYPESNGVISNFMYDSKRNKTFSILRGETLVDGFWYEEADPIWVTAAKQNKDSYWYAFPYCDADFGKYSPHCVPYNSSLTLSPAPFKKLLSEALDKLCGTVDLAGVYYEKVDGGGHVVGPYSPFMKVFVKEVDTVINWLQDEIENRHLSNELNVIIVSDHGMAEIDISRVVNITHYVTEKDLAFTLGGGAVVSVWPAVGKSEKVYSQLKGAHPHLTVWRKNEVPERFHFRNNDRVPPIMLLADKGWFIVTYNAGFPKYQGMYIKGAHGYDNDISDVKGIFTARGPDFKENFRQVGFPNVDLYQVMCKILDLEPSPHNGTWDHVSCMMTNHDQTSKLRSLLRQLYYYWGQYRFW